MKNKPVDMQYAHIVAQRPETVSAAFDAKKNGEVDAEQMIEMLAYISLLETRLSQANSDANDALIDRNHAEIKHLEFLQNAIDLISKGHISANAELLKSKMDELMKKRLASDYLVPISHDFKHVFIDGSGLLPIDYSDGENLHKALQALSPLANELNDQGNPDETDLPDDYCVGGYHSITFGDLRRAKRVLDEIKLDYLPQSAENK